MLNLTSSYFVFLTAGVLSDYSNYSDVRFKTALSEIWIENPRILVKISIDLVCGVRPTPWINLHPSNREVSTFLIAISLICSTRGASTVSGYGSGERVCTLANILIVMTVAAGGCHCRWRGGILSTCWLYRHFAGLSTIGSIAPWKSDMTFALPAITSVPGSQSRLYYMKVRTRNHGIQRSADLTFSQNYGVER